MGSKIAFLTGWGEVHDCAPLLLRSFKEPFSEFTRQTSLTSIYVSDKDLRQESMMRQRAGDKESGNYYNIGFSQSSEEEDGYCS